ncbi:unnamed protein product [Closterium sp. Naga37s-1]|nr:unnamed protein product [Closterium sp. Naga37s-1]
MDDDRSSVSTSTAAASILDPVEYWRQHGAMRPTQRHWASESLSDDTDAEDSWHDKDCGAGGGGGGGGGTAKGAGLVASAFSTSAVPATATVAALRRSGKGSGRTSGRFVPPRKWAGGRGQGQVAGVVARGGAEGRVEAGASVWERSSGGMSAAGGGGGTTWERSIGGRSAAGGGGGTTWERSIGGRSAGGGGGGTTWERSIGGRSAAGGGGGTSGGRSAGGGGGWTTCRRSNGMSAGSAGGTGVGVSTWESSSGGFSPAAGDSFGAAVAGGGTGSADGWGVGAANGGLGKRGLRLAPNSMGANGLEWRSKESDSPTHSHTSSQSATAANERVQGAGRGPLGVNAGSRMDEWVRTNYSLVRGGPASGVGASSAAANQACATPGATAEPRVEQKPQLRMETDMGGVALGGTSMWSQSSYGAQSELHSSVLRLPAGGESSSEYIPPMSELEVGFSDSVSNADAVDRARAAAALAVVGIRGARGGGFCTGARAAAPAVSAAAAAAASVHPWQTMGVLRDEDEDEDEECGEEEGGEREEDEEDEEDGEDDEDDEDDYDGEGRESSSYAAAAGQTCTTDDDKHSPAVARFLKHLSMMGKEQILAQDCQYKCTACRAGKGEIHWWPGIHSLLQHAETIRSRRISEHRAFAAAVHVHLRERGVVLEGGGAGREGEEGTLQGQWRGVEGWRAEEENAMVLWPPVVIVRNTRLQRGADGQVSDEVGWVGMGSPELREQFADYKCIVKTKHAYGPQGHRGISALVFDSSPDGFQEAERLAQQFEREGRGRLGFTRRLVPLEDQSGKKNLFGYFATQQDVTDFNRFGKGKAPLKVDLKRRWEVVEEPLQRMKQQAAHAEQYKSQVVEMSHKVVKLRIKSSQLQESRQQLESALEGEKERRLHLEGQVVSTVQLMHIKEAEMQAIVARNKHLAAQYEEEVASLEEAFARNAEEAERRRGAVEGREADLERTESTQRTELCGKVADHQHAAATRTPQRQLSSSSGIRISTRSLPAPRLSLPLFISLSLRLSRSLFLSVIAPSFPLYHPFPHSLSPNFTRPLPITHSLFPSLAHSLPHCLTDSDNHSSAVLGSLHAPAVFQAGVAHLEEQQQQQDKRSLPCRGGVKQAGLKSEFEEPPVHVCEGLQEESVAALDQVECGSMVKVGRRVGVGGGDGDESEVGVVEGAGSEVVGKERAGIDVVGGEWSGSEAGDGEEVLSEVGRRGVGSVVEVGEEAGSVQEKGVLVEGQGEEQAEGVREEEMRKSEKQVLGVCGEQGEKESFGEALGEEDEMVVCKTVRTDSV